jgi:hypothetical protein
LSAIDFQKIESRAQRCGTKACLGGKAMKLVDDWKSAWKWFSVQLVAAATAVQLSVLAFPDGMRGWLPDWLTHVLAVVLLAAAVFGRLVDQKKPA